MENMYYGSENNLLINSLLIYPVNPTTINARLEIQELINRKQVYSIRLCMQL